MGKILPFVKTVGFVMQHNLGKTQTAPNKSLVPAEHLLADRLADRSNGQTGSVSGGMDSLS